ncbi:helix-turn-helix domain-containing protein [Nocardia sp. NPDC059246]|uniref:helix-turn-helix domain-containing protein n=1 Tax=unclassified Nocardia TaxID=2637762 RepID=UPI003689A804
MPRLGSWLQQVRDNRGLSQRQLALRTNISEPYIPKIEAGRIPSREVLDQLICTLSLNPMQARYTRDLWAPAASLPSIDELRERSTTSSRIEHLERLDDSGVIAVYTDPLWNILAANASFHRALPGLAEPENNLALWHFHSTRGRRPAMDVTLQWEHEAAFLVSILRGAFGRYRESPRARDLFERLRHDKTFARLWSDIVNVAYARRTGDRAQLRDPATGEPYSISIDIHEVADAPEIRVCYAIRHPPKVRAVQ